MEKGARNKVRTKMDEDEECLLTPSGRVEIVRHDFSGFRPEGMFDEQNTRESLLRRRIIHLEDLVKELMARLKIMEKDNDIMKPNTEELKKNYDDLKNKVCVSEKKMEDNEDQMRKICEKQNCWKMDQDQQKVNLKKNYRRISQGKGTQGCQTVIKDKECFFITI
ncbi:hypothetical protein E2C01_066966 [Portunus trituberculatus]|uniref:Uncharacterized protein n=1 Tax=Portunus trituberculatus TaxID=210409 RepID=A0A5B7HW78_PORTR|nr:hypothetical protein [Portunus trituberculatus]